MSRRHNGEGSIYPVKGGYRGYAWCTNPSGGRYRKYVKGKTYEDTQAAWLKLRDAASQGPVASDVPSLEKFLSYWLEEIVQPNLAPKTYEKYELFSRLHIIPHLGAKHLDKLQVRDIRQWLNKLSRICQCCVQGKDVARPEEKRRCCAIGKCCQGVLSAETRKDARNVLRAALTCAVEEQLITQNCAAIVRLPNRRELRRKRRSWTVDEARQFLESARHADDVLYAAYVLVLVLGLRKGELLGLTWELVDLCVTALSSAGSSSNPTESAPEALGSTPAWCSPPATARRSSRVTSAAASTAASRGRRSLGSPCMVRGRHAGHCWRLSMSTPAWPCRSCGTARSPSRWRSIPRFPRPPPVPPSRNSAGGSARERCRCCTLLLHHDQNGRSFIRNQPLSWEPRYGIEP
jgi:hypothetical protein